jgi:hypothetical protein
VDEWHEQRVAEIRRRHAERRARWAADPLEMRMVARRFKVVVIGMIWIAVGLILLVIMTR